MYSTNKSKRAGASHNYQLEAKEEFGREGALINLTEDVHMEDANSQDPKYQVTAQPDGEYAQVRGGQCAFVSLS